MNALSLGFVLLSQTLATAPVGLPGIATASRPVPAMCTAMAVSCASTCRVSAPKVFCVGYCRREYQHCVSVGAWEGLVQPAPKLTAD
jgi:hypothetical protein